MADTLYNQTLGIEITSDIVGTIRSSSLSQVVNVSLKGLVYIQNIGELSFQVLVDFVIHKDNDKFLYDAYKNANLIKVIDDDKEYYGYIISVELGDKYAEGYHTGAIVIQEEVEL